jgi:two-component system, LytTR family, response regulator
MPAFRVLTVDNEAVARRQLRGLLAADPECELIGECANATEAIRSMGSTQPHVVFADLRVPEMDAFEVVRAVAGRLPLVILTSDCGECAVRAFEARVFDYLLKPFTPARFHDSLSRAKAVIASDSAMMIDRTPLRYTPERIAVRRNGGVVLMKLDEIDWIEAADNYVCLHCGAETRILRQTMSEVEARLAAGRFIRIHRSAIVNIDRIKELRPSFRGDYDVVLRDGTRLTMTKSHRGKLDAQLLLGSFSR